MHKIMNFFLFPIQNCPPKCFGENNLEIILEKNSGFSGRILSLQHSMGEKKIEKNEKKNRKKKGEKR